MKLVEEYRDLIKSALMRIGTSYYKIPTTYEPLGIVRERIFCYELYHQIRLMMGPNPMISLHGEMDKRGHIDFDRRDWGMPDFVFHIPGKHTANTLVIEVKGRLDKPKGIMKDFVRILTFINRYQYNAGIFILYNHSFQEMIARIGQKLKEFQSNPNADSVYILTIKESGAECEEHLLSNINL
jgi:hypothetical protein